MNGANQRLGFMAIISLLFAIFLIQTGCQGEESAETNTASGSSEFERVESYVAGLNTKITAGPLLCGDTTTAKFKFKCTAAPCTFKCNLDDAGWAKCPASKTYTALAEGSHTLQVKQRKAFDGSGVFRAF